ncbi:protein 14-ALPHA-GLUCAN-BRANCHING ENZYME [Salix koriyanagi]|uniref:Protein 14-ALPHA-GLUCAN-BRANCHING ENZYME n=1 Tax=Salix koriyanagi TaxID=2511006 RepID=A0A9Q1ALP6_9ROSI|nr:protein 14-ALPHA-GLUCAN-BRANCHING ENZYME [Salix koriyanagi]
MNFPNKVRTTKCTASTNQQQQQDLNSNDGKKKKKKKKKGDDETEEDEEKKGINPVGFLTRHGISHKQFAFFLRERHKSLKDLKDELFKRNLMLKDIAYGFELMGLHRHPEHRMDFMEWAPGARYCSLIGDFNGWSPTDNSAREGHFGHDDYGYWFIILEDKLKDGQYNYVDDYDKGDSGDASIEEIFKKANDDYWEPGEDTFVNRRFEVPANDPVWLEKIRAKKPPLPYWFETRKGRQAWLEKYAPAIPHGSKYRVYFNTPSGPLERVPAWATYVQPDTNGNEASAIHWEPPPEHAYKWKNKHPKVPKSLRIYECHVGISGSEPKISSFTDFTEKGAGYNAIQLIGVVEHKDYFTVGYRVTNLYAVSSRYGTPDDFKRLVDEAHGLGLLVLLDIVHSYSAADEMVGLSLFDGSNDCYFHTGKIDPIVGEIY